MASKGEKSLALLAVGDLRTKLEKERAKRRHAGVTSLFFSITHEAALNHSRLLGASLRQWFRNWNDNRPPQTPEVRFVERASPVDPVVKTVMEPEKKVPRSGVPPQMAPIGHSPPPSRLGRASQHHLQPIPASQPHSEVGHVSVEQPLVPKVAPSSSPPKRHRSPRKGPGSPVSLRAPKGWNLANERPVLGRLRGPEKRLNEIAMRTLGAPVRFPNQNNTMDGIHKMKVAGDKGSISFGAFNKGLVLEREYDG